MNDRDPQVTALLRRLGRPAADSADSDARSQRRPWPPDDPALLAPRAIPDVADLRIPAEPDVPVRVYTPAGAAPRSGLIWCHPGGFTGGHVDDIDGVCRALAADSGACVVSVDYRLAPEDPYPAAVDDVTVVLEWLRAHAAALGLDGDRIAVGGQSSGATIAAAVALRQRDRARPVPAGQILAYPVLDPHLQAPSYRENDGIVLTADGLARSWDVYLGARAQDPPPDAAPLLARDLGGLPRTLVLAAGLDPARDDAVRYAEALRVAGNACDLVELPELPHAFLSFAGMLDAAQRCLGLVARWIRDNLAGDGPSIHHAGLPFPGDRQDVARRFYVGLLGLTERAVPVALASRPFIWLAAGNTEIHLIPTVRSDDERHVCIATSALDATVARFRAAGLDVDCYDDIPGRRQAFLRDPFGNLLELTQIE